MRLANLLASLLVAAFGGWFLVQRRRQRATTFAEAVPITDARWLDQYALIYADVAARIARARPETVRYATCARRAAVHPGPTLPAPYGAKWAVAFPEHNDGGNPGGSLVILKAHLWDRDLWAHEAAHLITGITDHPDWLFGDHLTLRV